MAETEVALVAAVKQLHAALQKLRHGVVHIIGDGGFVHADIMRYIRKGIGQGVNLFLD